jgi:hypothetical protein
MRLFFGLSLLLLAPVLRAETPELLAEAIRKVSVDFERWAYTQTTVVRDRKGRVEEERVVRYDPSQPYDTQWTLLSVDGRPATEREVKKHRMEMGKRLKERRSLGDRATVAEETPEAVTFEVPLVQDDNQRLPPEKFQVLARVNRERLALERINVKVRAALRVAVVVNVKSGGAELNFGVVDPAHHPAVTGLEAAGTASIMFVRVGGGYSAKRADFKRVTPYSERFQVKIGPLKAIDF